MAVLVTDPSLEERLIAERQATGADRYPLERGWYRWYRIVPSGEVAAELSLRIALFPFMLAGTPGM